MDSVPSSSRPSFSDSPTPTQGPIPLFDFNLRLLDAYLSFFQERRRIEETYVDSLVRLHRKTKSTDVYLDDRGDVATTRIVWGEVRDNLEREALTREAFCNTLITDVVNPLVTLRETQDRTRKRIKEDLKDSGIAYTDYAENVLPKLKSKYSKKFSEVEEQKKAAAVITPSSPLPTPSIGSEHHLSNSRSNPSMPSRPTVTSPQPLRALDRRPSGSGPTGRNRSPTSSTAFSDLAHQGKRQLNQLIGFLDKGSSGNSLGGNRENQALRTARTKREAEEADKEYRKAVHWLETLRLRRTKILEGGYKSLEMFVAESASVLRKALEKYTDNMTYTSNTQSQLSSHARTTVDNISPEKDVAKLKAQIPRSLASAIPDPILYQHGQVGFCNDLLFGISLVDYATAKGLQDGEVPKIIRICIREIDQRGSESEGIYRVSGRHAVVQALQHDIEKNERKFEFNYKDDVYAVASLLKLYLRELPEPVFRFPLQERIQHTEDIAEHRSNNFMLLRGKIRRLPPVHQATLKAIVEHLSRVVALSEKNKMDAKNVAIVFGSVIFGEDEIPKGGDLLSVQNWKDSLMEDLIINAQILYDEQHTNHPSPPLPPTPAGEPIPQFAYGSKRTKVASMPPTSSPTQDFTPRLPPRPTSSIHPSLRAGAASPTRGRTDMLQSSSQLRTRDKSSFDESPPPSPSAASTFYETEDSSPREHIIPERFRTPVTNMRSPSPLRPMTTETAEAPQQDAPSL